MLFRSLNLPTLDIQAKKRIVMAMTEEARTDIQTYLKKNKELIINVIKAKEKEASNSSSLTQEEQILVSFADKRKNLFAAHGMDFDTIKPTYYFVFITDGDTYRIEHLCTADVAVNFAKLYYKHNPGLTIEQLNDNFADVKTKIFYDSNDLLKNNTNPALNVKIANDVYFPKNIWSGKNIEDGKENYFSKLLTMINKTNNVSKDFKYEVIK